jgi:hypothetical protein
MATNARLFYAVQAIGFAPFGASLPDLPLQPSGFVTAHGVQNTNLQTTFNLSPVFELGQLELYENIEGIPDIQVTAQKVLDGYPLLYHLATPTAAGASLAARSNSRCFMALNVYPDTQDNASGTPINAVGLSGLYVSALTYTLNVDGNATEDLTLVGNDKVWQGAGGYSGFLPDFDGTDEPLSLNATSGGVQRREDVIMGTTDDESSIWPTVVPGIDVNGHNPAQSDGYAAHIQTVTISANLGRDQLFELGKRAPYHRYVTFPTEVTCAINLTASDGDNVDALADPSGGSNLSDERIKIRMRDGTCFDLGAKNKLASVTYNSGNAGTGGGSATITMNFSNYNKLDVWQRQDPAGAATDAPAD